MADIVTLGEAMLRLSPPSFKRLEQATTLDVNVGGAELNVAIGVKRLGLESAWVTKLPKNQIGRLVLNKARELGVDTSHIVWSDEGRAGVYFYELGAQPRASSVLYDRKDSAASMMKPGEIDWSFLKGAKVLHTTGITPALSQSCAETVIEAIETAKRYKVKVSFDVNYRSKLWSTKEAEAFLSPLMSKVDILITTDEDTWRVWNYKGTPEEIIAELKQRFGCPIVAITIREVQTVWRNRWSSMAIADKIYKSKRVYDVEIVDRLGAGDSFTAGFLYGYLTGDVQKGIDFGDAMAAFKHSFPGDSNYMTYEEIETATKAVEDLRVKR
ncbi:MAG: sugar kinase [Aigarchaeota archaeon]|nr:sugar kinase [Aigarchaeota archaeon]